MKKYVCEECGSTKEVVDDAPTPICCDKEMQLVEDGDNCDSEGCHSCSCCG